ncbi:membrane-bound metal-dependent hydrolase [Cupriavidus sp. GA3-3]|uniref:metal-dependent hydrolase n=1 Tax=Cupriavidus sp. GA3-3 TaxID=1229514 RepID=UPI00032F621B|nr:metal-dependent hydrolase [Cupriavidus sp. GA3-3]EON19890.1 membrane-bound metal-dependent hydrolase [Cupriavidus sp. GA3-3]
MDTITHALMGAQAALAIPVAEVPGRRLSTRERLLLGAAAGAFPDIDFLGFLVHPLRFLAQWHQGPTHSLLLLPAWGALLAGLFCLAAHRREAWREAFAVSCLGVASHIALDLVTVYGTRIFYPGSERRFSLGTSFLIDPLLSGIVVSGLVLALLLALQWRGRAALAGMALLCAYVGVQAVLRQRALELGNESLRTAGIQAQRVDALPQPFSPFNWKLIARAETDYRVAHVNLAGHRAWVPQWQVLGRLPAMARAYEPPGRMVWTERPQLLEAPAEQALAWQLWVRPDFADFRQFAVYPALSAITAMRASPSVPPGAAVACVWFTDLRYDLPALEDIFRYGYCRDSAQAPWRLYRLAYFSQDQRQRLE